ncbi:phosphoribosylformylglycinamidine synthase subunit PurL [Adhaeretor mobilis]|uniref:Phosphoribosylformylglycinamidine synthase subunit PurL n=1 Tax=Adhaeretor mobilis TaxID=1930276 RepID=A0A517MTZ4_9BACT|nr:phosphoribosylformylglycinamidine synthase subunit PurL [Adhaeretor mobilis]QDS98356.1 Phosphoribosylformylglycinamidine synthase subunit PurL [Adhaeretor mobilis]
MLWEIDLHPRHAEDDRAAAQLVADAADLHWDEPLQAASARSYLVQGEALNAESAEKLAGELFSDPVVETAIVAPIGDASLHATPQRLEASENAQLVHVLLKPGVMDPVAQSAEAAARDFGLEIDAVRTLRKYWIAGEDSSKLSEEKAQQLATRLLANDAIEQVVVGPLPFDRLQLGGDYKFEIRTTPIRELDDEGLMRLSREGQLYLQLAEMQTIRQLYTDMQRDPTDIELETIAQTWSEHCSHKTLAGRIAYKDENGERQFDNMLKETIFEATQHLRRQWAKDETQDDWCVSVFKDNAGIVRFDDQFNLAFKVETHNHPSALEPYGGANTGMGGVIRDTIGTGLGAKPICNTDVFCFAPPDTPPESLPPGVLHPKLVMRGVVEGVRDYGNRMGIPTVNGSVFFDSRYLGNPLVYCGNVGLIPKDKSFKEPQPGDFIVAVGGRTGRDGIHGATFSSAELTSESESLSGGAVQIGNAIEEKKVLDVLLAARDQNLFTSITDCGAGGFSSAVGEMGEELGAEVWLERAPTKYAGLTYTEIWISEAQERMVLSVPEEKWEAVCSLCESEDVEATILGKFEPTGRLVLKYAGETVADLSMDFLHNGRPPVIREANYKPLATKPISLPERDNHNDDLLNILGSLNVASKEWIIRQYDHEVQGGSVVKPLVGVASDGPSDAAIVRPVLTSRRGVVISNGMNPCYGDYDPYHMAASAIDEAIRNCVAVGADPTRIAILDNFCWGDCERNETLGSLVRAALACHDLSIAFGTPFISGKDSLNNEFSYAGPDGKKETIAIPPTLLISAMGQIADVASAVTMDLKQSGNLLYLVGNTDDELGGSHFSLVNDLQGGRPPQVNTQSALQTFHAIHNAINQGCLAACHDLSEGGLAVAAAEMAFAGGLGAEISLAAVPAEGDSICATTRLFSESNSRFLCEVPPEKQQAFEAAMSEVAHAQVGAVNETDRLTISESAKRQVDCSLSELKAAWQAPLDW